MNTTTNTSKSKVALHDYVSDGIRVERFTPVRDSGAPARPPVICVHGGCHASWCWQEHAMAYAEAGHDVHVLNWLGRNGSDPVPVEQFVGMSIADVVADIEKVAAGLDAVPVLIAHSMGGLAAQLYAASHPVQALVLLTPVVPSNAGATPIELPIGDSTAPWGPPPLEMTSQLFFQGLDEERTRHFHALLVAESPLRVYEATRWTLPVDAAKIVAPTLVVSGALDILTPADTGRKLADLYGADYRLEAGHGHNVLLGPGADRIAQEVVEWLQGKLDA
jgi:pimeloyl-ACP methyl ester carboxylesterase